jgi:hypothetical protein
MGMKSPTPMRSIRINGQVYGAVYGGTLAAPIFAELMKAALAGQPVAQMPPMLGAGTGPAAAALVTVPNVVGLRTADAQVQLQAAGFEVVIAPAVNAAPIPDGAIASQSPAGRAPAGATITIVPSNGLEPVATPSPTPTVPAATGKPKPHGPKATPTTTATPSP